MPTPGMISHNVHNVTLFIYVNDLSGHKQKQQQQQQYIHIFIEYI